ncbi:tyrosine-type recombinase/integrase [Rhodoplanes serenus]|uniref:Tyrosine-type recombinase/integrase n=1 Tax=Rhodoplanes serenus TaxID=200615 RepID=A0A9X5ARQ9_9BRAD|nr:tyrosine-type recombinase/integrase [Rhodoplanes serenus]MTW16607.1 tyrosine-type recombinase/integrase [Rhodoplanes serenus]
MLGMPRPRPPHVIREVTRHGRTKWYVRVGHGPRIRLRAGPGEPGFDAEYRAALAGDPSPTAKAPRTASGSIAWLIARYRETAVWTSLSPATRKQRDAIFHQVEKAVGHEPIRKVTPKAIAAARDRRAKTPFQARHYLDAMRGLFAWAVEAQYVEANPADGIRPPPRKTAGFPAWDADDVARFEARWPIGTRQRIAFAVLRFTGLRRGDAVRVGRPHVRNGVIRIKTEKTGQTVYMRIAPELAAVLAAGPTGDLTWIVGEAGKPLTKESFGNLFREWCSDAGVAKSAHGLRKLAATTMADRRATVAELEAVFGWRGGRMASLYTDTADRERLGTEASALLGGTDRARSIPAPSCRVRDRSKKNV